MKSVQAVMLKVVLSGLELFLGRLGKGKTLHLGLDWKHFSLSVWVMKVVLSLLESRVKPNSVWVHSEVFLVIQETERQVVHLGPLTKLMRGLLFWKHPSLHLKHLLPYVVFTKSSQR